MVNEIKELEKELANAQKQAKIKELKEKIKKTKGSASSKIAKFFAPRGNEDEALERLMRL